eukprot:Pgem_evm1s10073
MGDWGDRRTHKLDLECKLNITSLSVLTTLTCLCMKNVDFQIQDEGRDISFINYVKRLEVENIICNSNYKFKWLVFFNSLSELSLHGIEGFDIKQEKFSVEETISATFDYIVKSPIFIFKINPKTDLYKYNIDLQPLANLKNLATISLRGKNYVFLNNSFSIFKNLTKLNISLKQTWLKLYWKRNIQPLRAVIKIVLTYYTIRSYVFISNKTATATATATASVSVSASKSYYIGFGLGYRFDRFDEREYSSYP